MKLPVLDRLLLLGLLQSAPAESDITVHRIVRKLRDELGFSEQDHETLNLVSDDGKVTWDATKDPMKDIEIGPKATALIADLLTQASEAKKLRAEHLHLCDLFLPEQE